MEDGSSSPHHGHHHHSPYGPPSWRKQPIEDMPVPDALHGPPDETFFYGPPRHHPWHNGRHHEEDSPSFHGPVPHTQGHSEAPWRLWPPPAAAPVPADEASVAAADAVPVESQGDEIPADAKEAEQTALANALLFGFAPKSPKWKKHLKKHHHSKKYHH